MIERLEPCKEHNDYRVVFRVATRKGKIIVQQRLCGGIDNDDDNNDNDDKSNHNFDHSTDYQRADDTLAGHDDREGHIHICNNREDFDFERRSRHPIILTPSSLRRRRRRGGRDPLGNRKRGLDDDKRNSYVWRTAAIALFAAMTALIRSKSLPKDMLTGPMQRVAAWSWSSKHRNLCHSLQSRTFQSWYRSPQSSIPKECINISLLPFLTDQQGRSGSAIRSSTSGTRRWFAAIQNDKGDNKLGKKPHEDKEDVASSRIRKEIPLKKKQSKKIKVVNEITDEHLRKLAEAFDELARRDGFDTSLTEYIDTTDRRVDNDDDEDEEDIFLDDDEDLDEDFVLVDNDETGTVSMQLPPGEGAEEEDILDAAKFSISDFQSDVKRKVHKGTITSGAKRQEKRLSRDNIMDHSVHDNHDDDDEYIDFGDDDDSDDDDDEDEDMQMEERIAVAERAASQGRVTVPASYDRDLRTAADLQRLGFRPEANPFGKDETPRREQFILVTNPMTCSACGTDFQCRDAGLPGFLPADKYQIQVKLRQLEELQTMQIKEAEDSVEWTPEEEIEWLIQTQKQQQQQQTQKTQVEVDGKAAELIDDKAGTATEFVDKGGDINIYTMAESMGLDLVKLTEKKTICQRCHGLQNFGRVEDSLRPGWTNEPLLSQQSFRDLLRPIREKPAVLIALVDLFDFAGSVLPDLDAIAGDNPVIVAANKADLLPSQMGPMRVENWVRRELEYLGIQSLANVGGAVRLVSCKTGAGVAAMLDKARMLANDMECDIYVVGAANAGKSTLMNWILRGQQRDITDTDGDGRRKVRAGNANARKGMITTSPLPGTTLRFIKVDLGGGRNLYDTPGLLVPGTLTQLLTPDELKIAVPKKQVEPVTFRVANGKCVLIGGLARVAIVGDSRPFFLTFYIANDVKLHPTDLSKADEFRQKHAGTMLIPPLSQDRLESLGEWDRHVVEIAGEGWKQAAADIALAGLGWIAVTGAGLAMVEVCVPHGIHVSVRPPLMPMDVWDATAKYTGGRAVRKSTKTASGRRRKGVGRN